MQNTWDRYAEQYTDEVLQLTEQLCRIPAPSHHEEARAAFCADYLRKAGAKQVCIDAALNVVCTDFYRADDENIVFMAHTDTVFPDTEPFSVVYDGDRMCCPGITDDTVHTAILLVTARHCLQCGKQPHTGILFAANSCEEGLGNLKGARRLLQDYRCSSVISYDALLGEVVHKSVGSRRFRVSMHTEGGHSFSKFGNKNAIYYVSSMITTLYAYKPPVVEGEVTTFNVGTISGGTSVNTIAQDAEFLYEFRSTSEACLQKVQTFFDGVCEAYRNMDIVVSVTVVGERPCMHGVNPAAQEALVKRCCAAMEHYAETSCLCVSSTDCNIPLSIGIPAVAIGLVRGQGAHTREEYLARSSVPTGIKIALNLLEEYF